VSNPYRGTVSAEVYRAPTREGMARLEVAPSRVVLEVGPRNLAVTDRYVTVDGGPRRRRRSRPLDNARLMVARGVPVEEVGVWYEDRPGRVSRIFGLRPPQLLDGDALAAWRALDRLFGHLRSALAGNRGETSRAAEYGRGADRVLLVDQDERYVLYVRRLFRELPRRALEVRSDGMVSIFHKGGTQRFTVNSRFGVTVLGDHIQFADPEGTVLGKLWLPWVAPEDRAELARRFAERLHQPELDSASGKLTFPG